MFKKDMTPLTKGGSLVANKGKGGQQAPMPNRGQVSALARPGAGMNDYAKATPMAQPSPFPEGSGY